MINFINFYLSGGSNNNNPNLSLGGLPSKFPVANSEINNLFDNVTVEQAKTGNTEYRCFYLFNDSSDRYLYNSTAYLIQTSEEGADVQLGVSNETEIQQIKIIGDVVSGNVKFGYENNLFVVDWNGLDDFVNDFSYELNSSTFLSQVVVQGTGGGLSHTINITFGGEDDNKNHELLSLVENNLVGSSGSPEIQISKLVEGSPVNTISNQLSFSEIAPKNITFYDTNINNKINLGKLCPGDGCPIWIKRTINPNSIDAIEGDGFIFKLSGNPFKLS
jgi:hypothetical protein